MNKKPTIYALKSQCKANNAKRRNAMLKREGTWTTADVQTEMDTYSIGDMTEQPPELGKDPHWKQEKLPAPSQNAASVVKVEVKKTTRVISIVPQKRIDLNIQPANAVLASADNKSTELRLNDKCSMSVDKLATSTRTPNRYDIESLQNKTISQDLEVEANRHKSRETQNFEALSQIAPLNLNKLIQNINRDTTVRPDPTDRGQTDRGMLDLDSISGFTSIDDGEQRYETEDATTSNKIQKPDTDKQTHQEEMRIEDSSEDDMEDLGDEGEVTSNVASKSARAPPDDPPQEFKPVIETQTVKSGYDCDSEETKSASPFGSQPLAKIPDSFVSEELMDESFRESYVEQTRNEPEDDDRPRPEERFVETPEV